MIHRCIIRHLTFFRTKIILSTSLVLLSACSSVPQREFLLEMTGEPSTRCEIINDQKVIGTFTVPSTINLGSQVGKVEANCRINNKPVVSKIQTTDAQCQEQLVVKGPCTKPTAKVESVEIVIRESE